MGSVIVHKCKINPGAANRVRNSSGVKADLLNRAKKIEQAANAATPQVSSMENPNYVSRVRSGKQRASAVVIAANAVSIAHNRKHNTLLKSMDAGGD